MAQPPTVSPPRPVPPVPPPSSERRTAWAEGLDRVRKGATTEPGRLRIIGALLAALVVAFGAVTASQTADRAAAADDVVNHSQQLSADAASIYRSLADADTSAAAGFLAGGQWPREVRERYDGDIGTASKLLVKAAANSKGSPTARRHIAKLTEQLPVYTGLIEQARANNRQGLPLGGAYLRYANEQMRSDLLPPARALYETETARLESDYGDAEAWPWPALVIGLLVLAALGWAQHRAYRRTNRVFNHGLITATAASVVVLVWLVAGHAVARSGLTTSYDHGARSLRVLTEARIDSLQARGDESLTLVARGAVLTKDGQDVYEVHYRSAMRKLVGDGARRAEPGTLLAKADELANDTEGRAPVRAAVAGVLEWQRRHKDARTLDGCGDYEKALAKVIGKSDTTGRASDEESATTCEAVGEESGTTGETFDEVDGNLKKALLHEQREFRQAASDGLAAFSGLPTGAAALAVLGAVGAVLGIGRRLSEYR